MESRPGLCLAGGGVLGAAYEVGALAAVEEHLGSGEVERVFDIFVGVSAGAVVASFLAQGVRAGSLYERFEANAIVPSILAAAARMGGRRFRIRRFEQTIRELFAEQGLSNRFADLPKTLLIPAVDIDATERETFGRDGTQPATVTEAVAASCAIPGYLGPYTIGRRRFVDGGVGSPIHIDLAIDAGATHILAVDPIAPLRRVPARRGASAGRRRQAAIPVLTQCERIEHASRSALALANARLAAPHVPVLFLRPPRREMYAESPMDWSAKDSVLRLGYELTARQLEEREAREFFDDVARTISSGEALAHRRPACS